LSQLGSSDKDPLMKRVLIVVAIVVVLGGAGLGFSIWRALSPTTGVRIEGNRPGKALVLVDLQEDYTGPKAKQPYAESARLIAGANQIIEAARAGGWPVFLVRVTMPNHWWNGLLTGFTAMAGTSGAEFDARLLRAPEFVEITKTKPDAFSNPTLDAQLAAHQVGQLYIAGLDAAYCVKTTIAGALNRGYAVNVVRDIIATRHGTPLEVLVQGYQAKGAVLKSLDQAKVELGTKDAI
jgi:nicotinamidase-related amidase